MYLVIFRNKRLGEAVQLQSFEQTLYYGGDIAFHIRYNDFVNSVSKSFLADLAVCIVKTVIAENERIVRNERFAEKRLIQLSEFVPPHG